MGRSRFVVQVVAATLALCALVACGSEAPPARVEVHVRGSVIHADTAFTPEERGDGLSGRPSLKEDEGMLFVLESERVPAFTMRGMLFPLDFVWITEEGRVLEVTMNVAPQDGSGQTVSGIQPSQAVRYVLEVNAGTAARLGLEPGDEVRFEPEISAGDAT